MAKYKRIEAEEGVLCEGWRLEAETRGMTPSREERLQLRRRDAEERFATPRREARLLGRIRNDYERGDCHASEMRRDAEVVVAMP